jgi:hypothetical protein
MPLSVSVGLSRKASRDYQSAGASINLTAELDQSLLTSPVELQRRIDELYFHAEEALARNACTPAAPEPAVGPGADENGSGGPVRRAMTENQRRAIIAIATRLCVDPHGVAVDIHGVDLDHLSLRQASELIDHLRSQAAAAANGH